ncbi:hypothetical protein BX666DRAFT_2033983 [Dichotomocladium elegans]|nr:hypothetical protein BX666DRAFT_2033983 [Dichotomocladium elegans]
MTTSPTVFCALLDSITSVCAASRLLRLAKPWFTRNHRGFDMNRLIRLAEQCFIRNHRGFVDLIFLGGFLSVCDESRLIRLPNNVLLDHRGFVDLIFLGGFLSVWMKVGSFDSPNIVLLAAIAALSITYFSVVSCPFEMKVGSFDSPKIVLLAAIAALVW